MATIRSLTTRRVDTVKAPPGRDLWLNDGAGLWLHVRPSGGKAWRLRYTVNGKRRILDLGDAGIKSLAEARTDAARYREQIDRDIDPIEQAEFEQAAARESEERRRLAEANKLTFSAAVDRWAQAQLQARKDQGREALRGLRKDILNTLGDLELPQLRKGELVACLDDIVARGSRRQANVALRELKQFFSWAEAREWIARSPLAGVDKAHVGGPEAERDRVLSPAEIVLLRDQIPAANLERRTVLAIWIMLSTLCRVGELTAARWDAVDLDAATWTIPAGDSKNGLPHVVFLSTFARHQFKELRTITGWSQWVFPASALNDRPARREVITKQIYDRQNDLAHSHRCKALHTLMLPGGNWTPHDLRRTGATLMGENGVLGEVIERCLNHKEARKVVRTYQRQELLPERRQAWQALGEVLDEILNGKRRKVVRMVRGAA